MVNIYFHNIITDNNDLSWEFFDQCREVITKTIHNYSHHLTYNNINIEFSLTNLPIPTMNISWYTRSPYIISISISEEKNNIDELFISELKSCSIHELHHTQRRNSVGYWETFQEVLITEWLACLAEIEANPIHTIPYIQSNKEEIKLLLNHAKVQNEQYNHEERYYGIGHLQNRSGYKLWFYLINEYSKNIWKTARDLANTNYKDIINDTEFKNILTFNP